MVSRCLLRIFRTKLSAASSSSSSSSASPMIRFACLERVEDILDTNLAALDDVLRVCSGEGGRVEGFSDL